MTVVLSNRAADAIGDAPPAGQRAFYKQLRFLAGNLNHPSLHAKKYDEAKDVWQGRVNKNWRFYFIIEDSVCFITDRCAASQVTPWVQKPLSSTHDSQGSRNVTR